MATDKHGALSTHAWLQGLAAFAFTAPGADGTAFTNSYPTRSRSRQECASPGVKVVAPWSRGIASRFR
jgi:hypothetical protein